MPTHGAQAGCGQQDRRRRGRTAPCGLLVVGTFVLGVLGAPSIESIDNRFGEVDETTTELVINNPNSLDYVVTMNGIDYVVTMNGVGMVEGDREGVNIGG